MADRLCIRRIAVAMAAALLLAGCASAQRPVRILFVGNSYTYYNDLPEITERLYEASGAGAMETGMLAQAGQTLSDAAGPRLPELLHMMLGGRWDYVVLQEQSTLGGGYTNGRPMIGDPAKFHAAVRLLDREIRKAGGRTVLLMTWANEHAPEQQAAISSAYSSIADETSALLVPAGDAWKLVRSTHRHIRLHEEDGSHPSANGSYLVACTLLSVLFDLDLSSSPTRMEVTDLLSHGRKGKQSIEIDATTAVVLREAASRVGRAVAPSMK